jgi:toxin FitB
MFLLDTDALSELEKPDPDRSFIGWLDSVDWLDGHLSVITLGELWAGISQLAPGRKRRALEAMFELRPDRFYNRIIPVDQGIAVKFGEIQAQRRPLPSLDTLIAATAVVRRLTLVTHNSRDMGRAGASILDPWQTPWLAVAGLFGAILLLGTAAALAWWLAPCVTSSPKRPTEDGPSLAAP